MRGRANQLLEIDEGLLAYLDEALAWPIEVHDDRDDRSSTGTVTLIRPTVSIAATGEKHTVDGIEMVARERRAEAADVRSLTRSNCSIPTP